jgi:hypothetical protein
MAAVIAFRARQVSDTPADDVGDRVDGLSDMELLSSALQDALAAYASGVLIGPGLDEVGLRRAAWLAWASDANRLRRAIPDGAA